MAIVFDPLIRRIILDRPVVSAYYLWSRWCDWAASGDNLKYLPAFTHVGGDPTDNDDPLLATEFVPSYIFLENDWRVRPMEMDHDSEITGLIRVRGGGNPFVRTLGQFQVNTRYKEPTTAIGIATGGSTGPTAQEIALATVALLESSGGKLDQTMKAAKAAKRQTL